MKRKNRLALLLQKIPDFSFVLATILQTFPINCNSINTGKFKELAGFALGEYEEQLGFTLR